MNVTLALFFGGVVAVLLGRAIWESVTLRRASRDRVREHDMERVAAYFEATALANDAIPAQTWGDLHMDAVFAKLDRTASWPGQHLLYSRLRHETHTSASAAQFSGAIRRLQGDKALRNSIADALAPLDHRAASALPRLFQQELPRIPAIAAFAPVLSVLGAVCLLGAIRWHPLVIGVAAAALVNSFVRAALKEKINLVIPPARRLPAMWQAARTLEGIDARELASQICVLKSAEPKLRWIARTSRWFSFEPTGGNELADYLYEYINILFLADVTAFVFYVRRISEQRDTIAAAYAALGELDALQSVATLRAERSDWCTPEFVDGRRVLDVDGLVHPLLEDGVSTSVQVEEQNMLLTGSNMSGKSTFIRAVGVNAILAQAIDTTFATRWHSTRFAVRTSIGRSDSLADGKSYYRAEVDAIGELLVPSTGLPRLILIDELFRGTNSIERVAAARAVLAHFETTNDLVIVATHDVDLLGLLPQYAPFHFREEVRESELVFDYQLYRGICSTRNAIAILALAGYPQSVVDAAQRTADQIGERVAVNASPAAS